MRIRIVYDKTGRIMAAAEFDAEELIVLPETASQEHTAIDVEVPLAHQKGDLAGIRQTLCVDPRRARVGRFWRCDGRMSIWIGEARPDVISFCQELGIHLFANCSRDRSFLCPKKGDN